MQCQVFLMYLDIAAIGTALVPSRHGRFKSNRSERYARQRLPLPSGVVRDRGGVFERASTIPGWR